jgi:hypothetical protein
MRLSIKSFVSWTFMATSLTLGDQTHHNDGACHCVHSVHPPLQLDAGHGSFLQRVARGFFASWSCDLLNVHNSARVEGGS